MNEEAHFDFAAASGDIGMIGARSAGIWIALALDDDAHAALRRDGLDPGALRLSGLHPFSYDASPEDGIRVTAHAADAATAEALLALFQVHFLRRLAI